MPITNKTEVTTLLATLKIAYKEKNDEKQLQVFQRLGDEYVADNKHIDAIALYNFALAICLDETKNSAFSSQVDAYQDTITADIKQAEADFLQILTGKAIAPASFELDQVHRDYMTSLRNEARGQLAQHQALVTMLESKLLADTERLEKAWFIEQGLMQAGISMQQIYRAISEQLRQFVKDLIIECKGVLGEPPCDYAIICFGSLARDEATPYSDLEFGILIEDIEQTFSQLGTQYYEIEGKSYAYQEAARLLSEQYKDYFRKLTKLLNIKVINLGETTPRIQNIADLKEIGLLDRYAQSPNKHGFCFDGQMQGACKTPLGNNHLRLEDDLSYELICTPQQLSHLSYVEGWQKDRHFPTALSAVALLDGNQALVSEYQAYKYKKNAEPEWIKQKAIDYLSEAVDSFAPQIGIYREQNIYVSAKYHLYRLPNMIVVHLAMYYNLQTTNIWDSIDELKKSKLVDAESIKLLTNLKIAASQATKIRLASYLEKNYQHNDTELPDIIAENKNDEIISIYKLLIPFYMNLKSAIYSYSSYSGKNLSLKYEPITKNESFIQGYIYNLLLDYEKAIQCYQQALGNINDNIGKSACHSALGNAYYEQGKHNEALKHHSYAHEPTKYSPDKVVTAKNLINLSTAYYSLSNYNKALECLRQANKLMEDKTLINLRDKAILLNNMGATFYSLGNFPEAREAIEQSYQLHRAIDPENLSSMVTLRLLSDIYVALGMFDKAEEECKKGLAIIAKKFGEEHAVNIDIYDALANIYINLNKFSEAQQSIKKGLTIFKSYHGNNRNRHWARLYEHKAEIKHKLCLFDKALKAYTKAENVLADEYGKDSNALAHTLGSKALVYDAMEDYTEAENLIHEALALYKNKKINLHYNIGKLNLLLANLKVKKLDGIPNDSILKKIDKLYKRAEDIFKKVYGNELFNSSSENASILISKAQLYPKTNDYPKGISSLRKAKGIYERVCKDNKSHAKIAECYNGLGSMYHNKKAGYYYQKALIIYQQAFPNQIHTNIAETKNNLASFHSKQGQYLTALKLYNEAYTILKQIYDETNQHHPKIGFLLIAMADVFYEWAEHYPHTEWERNNNKFCQTEAKSCLLQASRLYFKEALNITKANNNKKLIHSIKKSLSGIDQKILKSSIAKDQSTKHLIK